MEQGLEAEAPDHAGQLASSQADFDSRHGLPKVNLNIWVRASRPKSTGFMGIKRGEADMPAKTGIECWSNVIHFRFDRLPDTTWLAGLV